MNYQQIGPDNRESDLPPSIIGYGGGEPVDIEKYKTIHVIRNAFYNGYYSTSSTDSGPFYKSNVEGFLRTSAKRLEDYKWVPFNSLEKSFTEAPHHKVGWNSKYVYTGAYIQVLWPRNSIDSDPVADYFTTLQNCDNIDDYLRLLAWYDLTGVSLPKIYIDAAFPDLKNDPGAYFYRGSAKVNPAYANFWIAYKSAVADFAGLIQKKILEASQLTQKISQQFDLVALEEYLHYIQGQLGIGLNKVSKSYIQGRLNQKFGIISIVQDGLRQYTVPAAGTEAIAPAISPDKLWGSPAILPPWDGWQERNIYGSPILINNVPLAQVISDMWDSRIAPLAAQIDWLAVQIGRLRDPSATFTKEELDLLTNIDNNLFLALDLDATRRYKTIITNQLAKAPLIVDAPKRVQLPGLQYKYNAALKINDIKAEFAPHWSISFDPIKVPAHNGGKKSSVIPLILAAAGVAAVAYYSNR